MREVSAEIMFREFPQEKAATPLGEIVGARIPEGIVETNTSEDLADFVGVWTSRCG